MTLKLNVHGEIWPTIMPFRITGTTFVSFESMPKNPTTIFVQFLLKTL